MKKILALILCLALTEPVAAYAADTKTVDPEKTVFTMSEATEYMLGNSLEIKAAEENISYMELKQKADAGMRKRLNNKGAAAGVNDFNTMLVIGGYVEYSDGVQYEIAKRNLPETKYKLKMQLENKFYSCLNADKKIIVALKALETAEENERIATAKAEAGVIGSIEAESFSLAVISAENDYNSAVRGRDYMYSELKQLMGYPYEKEITLTGTFERQPMNTTEIKTALDGLDKNANKLNLDAGLELQKKLLDEYRALYTTSMVDYQAQKYAYADAEAEYNENVGKLRLAVTNAYNTMVDTYDKLAYIDKSIELLERQADAKRTTYELGMSTATEYITAVQQLDSLRLSLVDAELGAYLTSRAYEMTYHKAEQ